MSCPVTPSMLEKKSSPTEKGFADGLLRAPPAASSADFVTSPAGRTTRIVAELEEFPRRMERLCVRGTFLFFGSARVKYDDDLNAEVAQIEAALAEDSCGVGAAVGLTLSADDAAAKAAAARTKLEARLKSLNALRWAGEWMIKTEELSKKLTVWSMSPEGRRIGMLCKSHIFPNELPSVPVAGSMRHWYRGPFPSIEAAQSLSTAMQQDTSTTGAGGAGAAGGIPPYVLDQPLVVCSGGGPGFMEAANKGAYDVGGVSMGVAISLPFETKMNSYVTPGLHFQMDYFFTRKFWEVFVAKAMICCPGGMGTCDEMFEVLTLAQCGHCQKMPVVCLGKTFWKEVINWERFAEYGVISQAEVDAICFTDSPDEAFEFIVSFLRKEAEAELARITAGVSA